MGVNNTKYKALEKIARDPRVIQIWDEDEDGIWVSLKSGYNWQGCTCVHEWTVKAIIESMKEVEEGSTY